MAIVINATRNISSYAFSEMLTKLRPEKKVATEAPKLSAKEEVKPAELSKKEEIKVEPMLAPEAEVLNTALSPASEPVEEVIPEENAPEETTEAETPEELEIVVKSDELTVQTSTPIGYIQTEDKMDYNGDGEVTLDEKMRYLDEQSKSDSLPEVKTVENTQNATSAQKPEVPEMKTIEIPEQNKTFEQAKLTGTQKFNYNNLQKAYAPKLQAQQVFVNQVA